MPSKNRKRRSSRVSHAGAAHLNQLADVGDAKSPWGGKWQRWERQSDPGRAWTEEDEGECCLSDSHCSTPRWRSSSGAARAEASRVNLEADRARVRAWRQNALNCFVLEEARKVTDVARSDHQAMLHMLLAEAYRQDPDRCQNAAKWRGLLSEIHGEYFRASAMFTFAPDPYQTIVSKLSSMMMWSEPSYRHWSYAYHGEELDRRREIQLGVLHTLQESGRLFL